MHKLVFKKDGLPNGTEVTYFSGGKVGEIKLTRNIWLLTNF